MILLGLATLRLVRIKTCEFGRCKKNSVYELIGTLSNQKKYYCEDHAEIAKDEAQKGIDRYHEMKAP